MTSEEKTKMRKRSRKVQESKEKKCSRRKKKKSQIIYFSKCVPECILKVSDYIGTTTVSEQMKEIEMKNYDFDFEKIVRFFTKNLGLKSQSVSCYKFDPLLVDPEDIYLLRLCLVRVDNYRIRDNFHSITLFDNKICDVDIEQPLSLTKDNLNRCCLSGFTTTVPGSVHSSRNDYICS